MDQAAPDPLRAIRSRIDAIDAAMHRLLIERSGVIAELIRVKGTAAPGAAFRPDREADMMRRLVERHEGALPITAVEHIWREIITTFTAMQAPFGIAAGPAPDPLAMRDTIRFYFGFSIPVVLCDTTEAAIRLVAAQGGRIAVIAAASGGRWWTELAGRTAPKVFGRLPFIELPSRPADLPAYVVGPSLNHSTPPDIRLIALQLCDGLEAAVVSHGGQIAGREGDEILAELPIAATPEDLAAEIGRPLGKVRELGGFAQPIRFVAPRKT